MHKLHFDNIYTTFLLTWFKARTHSKRTAYNGAARGAITCILI